jgi:hypothetical protein
MTAQVVEPLADLAAAYPHWHIWRSKDGRGADKGWCATRQRRLRQEEIDAGMAPTLFADDAGSLRGQLAQQAVIEQRFDGGGR